MRGLKLTGRSLATAVRGVAPLAGAWIEIRRDRTGGRADHVAPLAGAWIEI